MLAAGPGGCREDPQRPGSFINGRIVPGKNGIPEVQEYKAGMAPVNNADGTPGALQQLTGIYVNLLPENDVLRIRRGIRVHSLPELQALLEDLGG